jgi:hypothetical protein
MKNWGVPRSSHRRQDQTACLTLLPAVSSAKNMPCMPIQLLRPRVRDRKSCSSSTNTRLLQVILYRSSIVLSSAEALAEAHSAWRAMLLFWDTRGSRADSTGAVAGADSIEAIWTRDMCSIPETRSIGLLSRGQEILSTEGMGITVCTIRTLEHGSALPSGTSESQSGRRRMDCNEPMTDEGQN